MRDDSPAQLRSSAVASDSLPVREPVAKLVRDAMNALGWKQSEVARATGLTTQLVSQIVNRRRPYGKPPEPETIEALARIPGVPRDAVMRAVAQSIGLEPPPEGDVQVASYSGPRRLLHAMVDELPEQDVSRALQVLLALRN